MNANKTPVTILHEMMAKIGKFPVYELCPNQFHGTQHCFTYKVTCDEAEAIGSGKSKKDAKHSAATALLGKLRNSEIISQVPTPASNNNSIEIVKILKACTSAYPSSNSFLDNNIQDLIRLCAKFNLEEPVYKEIDPSGPPHSRIYTSQCSVAAVTVSGTGKSKKQAKNNAAKLMVDQLKDMFCTGSSSNGLGSKKLKISNADETLKNFKPDDEALKESANLKINYDLKTESERKELRKNLSKLLPNPLVKLDNLATLVKECQENVNEENITRIKQEFQMLLQAVKIDFHHMLLQSMTSETFMLIIQLNTDPDILEMSIGSSREEAELRTINKIIETLKGYLA